ncbi:hypothetical protein [Argonema galeatum]|uniref:hypothetical protein n=1 Tax=Argonema galeatum TaxID=2942762 RepID=UPI0020128043|nr:hypothetical protein [Argonema galeatum]MCL1465378.1 hypothetical protein [Argonema galeatum A003/A1]
MLLLYSRLFGLSNPQSVSKTKPPRISYNPSETELEQESSAQLRQTKVTESIRKIRHEYHLDRRFLL